MNQIADNFVNIWNNQDFGSIEEVFSDDCEYTFGDTKAVGVDQIKAAYAAWSDALEGLHFQVDHKLSEGNMEAHHWSGRAVFHKAIGKVQPTGKEIGYKGISLFSVNGDGKINRVFVYADLTDVLQGA